MIVDTTAVHTYRNILYVGLNGLGICGELFEDGYAGLSLYTCKQALAWLEKQIEEEKPIPDTILVDAEITDPDLESFVKSINRYKPLAQKPLILLSRKDNASDKAKALKLKADDLFYRPYVPADIAYRLNFLIPFKEKKLAQVKISHRKLRQRVFKISDRAIKRTFDIVASGMGLLVLSPLLLLIAIIIKLESRGSIFYISKRAGTGYQVFDFYKFRSMRQDADKLVGTLMQTANQYGERKGKKDPQFFKVSNDPRITRFGAFLRKTSLDELPQLFNVFKGDMSLVGNRPLPLYEAETLTSDQWVARFSAPAGITGLWQITKRGKAEMSAEERMELDIQYAQTYSFWTDLKIILKTIPALIQKEQV